GQERAVPGATGRQHDLPRRQTVELRRGAGVVVLGLESSCDDSAAAVLRDGRLASSIVSSQDEVHGPYGGVVPELASRHHVPNMLAGVGGGLHGAGGRGGVRRCSGRTSGWTGSTASR